MRSTLLVLVLLVPPSLLPAQTILILSKYDHTVALVDPATLKVSAKAPVGDDPHEVIASSDGRTAYISDYGFGAYNTMAVIDLASRKPLAPINLGPLHGPHGLAFAGGKLYFTAETNKVIARYDPALQKVDWILGTGQNRTHMISVSDHLDRIVTTNVSSGTVSIFTQEPVRRLPPPPMQPGESRPPSQPPGRPAGTPGTDWIQTIVKVGNGSEGFDLSPDGKEIWVANAQDATLSVIDLASKSVSVTIQSNTPGANRLKFTAEGAHVLVSTRDGLVIFDANTRKEIKRLSIGRGCAGILIEPAGHRAFVACTESSTVSVIDLRTLTMTGQIDAGPEPDGIAWAIKP